MNYTSTMQTKTSERSLPKGWQWVKLGDYCQQIDYGYTASANFRNKEPRFLRITDIQNGIVDWDTVPGCEINSQEEAANLLIDGDIVFARTGATTGKSFLIKNPPRAVFASYLIRVRPNSQIDPDFLYTFFQSDEYWKQIRARARGGAQPNVNATLLSEILIPLAPLDEQQRIASRLNDQLAAVESARKTAEEQLHAAKRLERVYLVNLFDGEVSRSWERKSIGSVAKIQTGYAFKSEWFTPDGIRLLRNANIFQGYIDWTDSVSLPVERRHEFKAFEMKKGDIVLSLDRPLVNNGLKVARMTEKDLPSLLLQRVARFQLSDSINSDYLYYFLRSPFFIDEITGHDQSIGVPHVSPKKVESVKLSLPDLRTQEKLARDVQEKLTYANQLCDLLESQLAEIESLPASLLREAFAGQG